MTNAFIRKGGSQRGPQPDPVRRPAPGITELREGHRAGYGSPEGKVPAGAGTFYRDTDPSGSGSMYKKTTPSGNTGWEELGAGGGGGGAGTFLRVTWCGGMATEADFNNDQSTFDKLLTWEEPTTVEQSGGFTFSDHPSAMSIDWGGPTTVSPNHTLHRITVPEDGLYTIVVNYSADIQFTAGVAYIILRTRVMPDTLSEVGWFYNKLAADTYTSGQFIGAEFTVELHADTPFWIETHPFAYDADGTLATADLGPMRVRDASLSVFKEAGGSGGGALTWADVDLSGASHLSLYPDNPAQYAIDGNFVYLRGAVKWVAGWTSGEFGETVVVPGGAPVHNPQWLPAIYTRAGTGTPVPLNPLVGFTGSDGFVAVDVYGGGVADDFGIFFLDGLMYSIS
jgi:hypothetical protein